MESPLPLFRVDYGRIRRRNLAMRFNVLAWIWYAEDEGLALDALGSQDPDRLIIGLCWAAYRSECAARYKRPRLTRPQVEHIIDGLPSKEYRRLLTHINGTRIFGRTPEEYAADVAKGDTKKKKRPPGGS